MINNIRFLEYDSKLFGYKVAELININSKQELENTLLKLKNENYKLCYFCIDSDDNEKNIWAKELNGFLADTKVTFSKELYKEIIKDEQEIVIYQSNEINDELLSLTYLSGKYSRFRNDPNFNNNEFEKLYYDWIKKSVNKEIADYVLIYQINDEIVGFTSIKLDQDIANISLIAVHENYQSLGLGSKLLRKAEFLSYNNNCEEIHVSTQEANISAMKFYLKNNYSISLCKNIFHFWL